MISYWLRYRILNFQVKYFRPYQLVNTDVSKDCSAFFCQAVFFLRYEIMRFVSLKLCDSDTGILFILVKECTVLCNRSPTYDGLFCDHCSGTNYVTGAFVTCTAMEVHLMSCLVSVL